MSIHWYTEDQAYKDSPILDPLFPFLSTIPCHQFLIMSTYKHEAGDLNDLLSQLCQATRNFLKDKNYLERTTALEGFSQTSPDLGETAGCGTIDGAFCACFRGVDVLSIHLTARSAYSVSLYQNRR
jgi:hypothetical protein